MFTRSARITARWELSTSFVLPAALVVARSSERWGSFVTWRSMSTSSQIPDRADRRARRATRCRRRARRGSGSTRGGLLLLAASPVSARPGSRRRSFSLGHDGACARRGRPRGKVRWRASAVAVGAGAPPARRVRRRPSASSTMVESPGASAAARPRRASGRPRHPCGRRRRARSSSSSTISTGPTRRPFAFSRRRRGASRHRLPARRHVSIGRTRW